MTAPITTDVAEFSLRCGPDDDSPVVATGVLFAEPADVVFPDGERLSLPAGWCRITWIGENGATALWASAAEAMAALGNGSIRLVWS